MVVDQQRAHEACSLAGGVSGRLPGRERRLLAQGIFETVLVRDGAPVMWSDATSRACARARERSTAPIPVRRSTCARADAVALGRLRVRGRAGRGLLRRGGALRADRARDRAPRGRARGRARARERRLRPAQADRPRLAGGDRVLRAGAARGRCWSRPAESCSRRRGRTCSSCATGRWRRRRWTGASSRASPAPSSCEQRASGRVPGARGARHARGLPTRSCSPARSGCSSAGACGRTPAAERSWIHYAKRW